MKLARVKIHAGDFPCAASHWYFRGNFLFKRNRKIFPEKLHSRQITRLELATVQSVTSIGAAGGWGHSGIDLLDNGLLTKLALGLEEGFTTFICQFADGRKLLASVSSTVFRELEEQVKTSLF
ncbi:MAG: hypothetical protein RPR40_03905 [Bermanella sp.]